MARKPSDPRRLYSMRETCRRTTLSESTIKRLIPEGLFPEWHLISGRRKAFYADEVDDWIANPPPFDKLLSARKKSPASAKNRRPPPGKK